MKQKILRGGIGVLALSACALLPSGCMDSDYNLDDVDMLVGVGGETLELPGNNSTRAIDLDDFLDLNDNNFIEIRENGDYTLSVEDDGTNTTTTSVDEIVLDMPVTSEGALPAVPGDLSGTIAAFEYDSRSVSGDIDALERAETEATVNIGITVPSALRKMDLLTITLPQFLETGNIKIDGTAATADNGNTITLDNLAAGRHNISFTAKAINFGGEENEYGRAHFNADNHTVSIQGSVKIHAVIDKDDFTDEGLQHLHDQNPDFVRGTISINRISVRSATGRFSPGIEFDNLGKVSLNDIPDFLTDDRVCLDLYDPRIDLRVNNTLPVSGSVGGTINAIASDGSRLASVSIPTFTVSAGKSVVSIRRRNAQAGGDTTVVAVENLSDLLKTVPSRLEFVDVKGTGDNTRTITFRLGQTYTLDGNYHFGCPLQFGEEARIVYSDITDGWNDATKDIMFKETTVDGQTTIEGYLQMTADITSKVPAYLTVSANGIDNNGNEISQNDLKVSVDRTVAASTDGKTPATTRITVKMQPRANSVLKRLDGIRYRMEAAAASDGGNAVTGTTINAYNHTLTVKNIKVTKHGRIVFDAN